MLVEIGELIMNQNRYLSKKKLYLLFLNKVSNILEFDMHTNKSDCFEYRKDTRDLFTIFKDPDSTIHHPYKRVGMTGVASSWIFLLFVINTCPMCVSCDDVSPTQRQNRIMVPNRRKKVITNPNNYQILFHFVINLVSNVV